MADHLFRQESGKLVSVLTGIFGVERLQLAEDVVQEALMRALRTWPYYGVPENPAAWITQTAKNLALDVLRREKNLRDKQPDITESTSLWSSDALRVDAALFEHEIEDAVLRMIFVCSHPMIPAESQSALALRTLCGFDVSEIANAFLTSEAAIAKRLTRAKQRIRDQKIPLELPSGEELESRLDGVLQTLYLLFNEGYKASSGDRLVREDLCREAIRLTTLVCKHPAGNQPRTHALLALMLLNGSHTATRVDGQGNILLLRDQDRSAWDRVMIGRGLRHLAMSASGGELSFWHLQAGIAATHCLAPSYSETDWGQILAYYDQLLLLDNSPVVALNRAVVVCQIEGPKAGLDAVYRIQNRQVLECYYLLYAVLAEFEAGLKNYSVASMHLEKAIQLTLLASEKAMLSKRLDEFRKLSVLKS